MPIAAKATFNYSATAAVTTAWTVTASTSIAVGNLLVLTTHYAASTSASVSAVVDSAGNVWTRALLVNDPASTARYHDIWYAPVTTTTANFQVAFNYNGKTVSARAAHLFVLSGVDTAAPLGATNSLIQSASTTTTLTLSLTTSSSGEFLIASGFVSAVVASTAADPAWTDDGLIEVTGGTSNFRKYAWHQLAGGAGIYKFSASLSNGAGQTRVRIATLSAWRPASPGSLTGTASVAFGQSAMLAGTASASGNAALAFAPVGTLTGALSASTSASVGFAATGSLQAVAAAQGTTAVSFAPGATIEAMAAAVAAAGMAFAADATPDGVTATQSAALAQAATPLGNGWDPRQFRKLLEQRRRTLLQQAQRLCADPGEDQTPAAVAGVAAVRQRLLAFTVAPARQAWRLREQAQALAAIQARLAALSDGIACAVRERDDEDILLLAA